MAQGSSAIFFHEREITPLSVHLTKIGPNGFNQSSSHFVWPASPPPAIILRYLTPGIGLDSYAFPDAPQVRAVQLVQLSMADISLPWFQFTNLDLGGQTIGQWLDILGQTPNIRVFALQPLEPSDGCLALRKLMANGL
ncbi:hypothetical protein B0H19DRAFT_1073962 [Mycena capillaripes]|nr:hypothetical protein B0H19DRAFT_1073962 [Mycena capillaripes]